MSLELMGMTALIAVLALMLSAGLGLPLVIWVLQRASRASDASGREASATGSLRGGTWIGLLERIAVTATILASHPEGVAVVVAIKGLGRFTELRNAPDVSERFVIGTLTSVLWAAAMGGLGRILIDLLTP